MNNKIYSRFSPAPKVRVLFDGERGRSRAKQSFKGEADVNTIMARYVKTGVMVDSPSTREPMYGDFSDGADLMSVQCRIVAVNDYFAGLPSDVCEMFSNSPAKMLDFVADPGNDAEAVALGLKEAPPAAPTSEPPPPDVTPPAVEPPVQPAVPPAVVPAEPETGEA